MSRRQTICGGAVSAGSSRALRLDPLALPVSFTTADAARHGVNIEKNVQDEPLPVKVDSDLVKQAMLNIVLNGVQAMPEGGLLRVVAELLLQLRPLRGVLELAEHAEHGVLHLQRGAELVSEQLGRRFDLVEHRPLLGC